MISVGLAGFLQAERLLDGDLVERVHRHLDVGELDARAVRLDADLDVVVDHPLDGDQDLHGRVTSPIEIRRAIAARRTARLSIADMSGPENRRLRAISGACRPCKACRTVVAAHVARQYRLSRPNRLNYCRPQRGAGCGLDRAHRRSAVRPRTARGVTIVAGRTAARRGGAGPAPARRRRRCRRHGRPRRSGPRRRRRTSRTGSRIHSTSGM